MAMAVMRNVPLGQNMHLLSNNCVLVSSANNQTSMQHHHANNSNNNHNSNNNNNTTHSNNHHHHQHQFGKRPIAPAINDSQRSNNSNTSSNINNNNTNNVIGNLQIDSNKITNKKKINFAHHLTPYGLSGIGNLNSSGSTAMGSSIIQPPSVQRRNARERNRVKQVNNGFANLRQHIPQDVITTLSNGGRGASKKLSKVDTLRLAVQYIRGLENLLGKDETDLSLTMSTGTITSPGGGSVSSSSTTSTNSSYFAASPITEQSTCSESSSSPAPSESSIGNVYVQQTIQSVQQHQPHQSTPPPPQTQSQEPLPQHPPHLHSHPHPHPQYKYEIYDTYNPEDEALLDCISWWQENP